MILTKLNGRGCKVLAEPNKNYDYVKAALAYDPIQIMTAQGNAKETLYPFKVFSNLYKGLYNRVFVDDPNSIRSEIENNLKKIKGG